jgi:hypothetical protein
VLIAEGQLLKLPANKFTVRKVDAWCLLAVLVYRLKSRLLLLVAEGQLLKLPANKFTVREREMLIGSGILPPEFFEATKNPFVIGAGARESLCHGGIHAATCLGCWCVFVAAAAAY